MNPPSKEKRDLGTALKGSYAAGYHPSLSPQPSLWAAEAERLASEFRRTHQARHFHALARHLDGVFERLTTGSKP
jgi:hypothetical protein